MTAKQRTADVTELDPHRDERREPPETVQQPSNPFTVADQGGGEVVHFDCALAFAYHLGIASITLTTQQQLVDPAGVPFEQRRITAILKASLPALTHLKNVIVQIEQRATDEAVAAVAALERPAGGLAH